MIGTELENKYEEDYEDDEYDEDEEEWDEDDLFSIMQSRGKFAVEIDRNRAGEFDTFEECIDFIKDKSVIAAELLAENKKNLDIGLSSIGVTAKEIQIRTNAKEVIPTFPDQIRDLYEKYRVYYQFDYLFESEWDSTEKYLVYNYHTVEGNKVFYVNKTKGEVDLVRAHNELKDEIEMIVSNYKVESEILLEHLNYLQAEIYMRCMMFHYLEHGEYILGSARNSLYFKQENIFKEPDHEIKVIESEFLSHYFPDIDQSNVTFSDDYTVDDLSNTAFYYEGRFHGTDERLKRVQDYLVSANATIYKKPNAKKAKSVILDGAIDYKEYLQLINENKKVINLWELADHISSFQKVKFRRKPATRLPRFDKVERDSIRAQIRERSQEIENLSEHPDITEMYYCFDQPHMLGETIENFSDKTEYIIHQYALVLALANKNDKSYDTNVWQSADALTKYLNKWGLFDEAVDLHKRLSDMKEIPDFYNEHLKSELYQGVEKQKLKNEK